MAVVAEQWLPNGKGMAVARGSTSSDVVRIQDF